MESKATAKFNEKFSAFVKSVTSDGNLVRLFFIMVGVFVLMAALRPEKFLTANNFTSMAYQMPEIGVFAIAVMMAMLLGGIDLSVVGVGNLSGIVATMTIIALQPTLGTWPSIWIGIALALCTGIACGFLNGFLIAKVGIPAMLATLGSMEIFSGIGIAVTKGAAVFGTPDEFTFIGAKAYLGIPGPMIVFILVVIIFTIFLQKKQYGMELYLLGTNPKASRFSGIKNTSVIIKTHVAASVLASIAGIIIASRANSAKADYGSSYTLQCLLVAILGGVNPSGGFGTVIGVVMAICTLQFLSSGFSILRFDSYLKTFIWGAVLIAAMIMNYYGNKMADKRKSRIASEINKDKSAAAENKEQNA